jgi:ABC-type nitrate/sulfonate/bicarbonate transport system ATPase subunit
MIEIKDLTYSVNKNVVFANLNASFENEKIISILGHSGCGKTTFLKLISGLLQANSGEVIIDDQKITKPGHERVIIFQDHQLFPWMTAKQNIEFALLATNQSKNEVYKYLDLISLNDSMDLFPHQLSGGMKQRVGIARALAAKPKVLLLDEPFASLDIVNRDQIFIQLLSIIKQLKISAFFVTHNIDEAIYLGDKVVTMQSNQKDFNLNIDVNFQKGQSILETRHLSRFKEIEEQLHNELQRKYK